MLKGLLKRVLGPLYNPLESSFRATATRSFRWAVDAMRGLRLIPRPESARGTSQRLLVISLTHHLGDTIMLLPMLERLRSSNPDAIIECAVEESVAQLFRLLPVVDRVHSLQLGGRLPANWRMELCRPLEVMREYWKTMRRMDVPDICLIPRWPNDLFRDRALAYLVGARRRIGYAFAVDPAARPAPYRDALLTEAYQGGNGLHESERFCLLLVHAGLAPASCMDDVIDSQVRSLRHVAEAVDWKMLAKRLGLPNDAPFAVIAPGASKPVRRWPLERWLPVARLLKQRELSIVVLTGPGDAATGRELADSLDGSATLVAGTTTFVETVALLAHACLFLGNDSGPSHVAGALGIPALTIFVSLKDSDPDGYSSVNRIHPLGPRTAFCMPDACIPPCVGFCKAVTDAHCIRNVTEAAVLRETERLLAKQEGLSDAMRQ